MTKATYLRDLNKGDKFFRGNDTSVWERVMKFDEIIKVGKYKGERRVLCKNHYTRSSVYINTGECVSKIY
jgi:hypothetical protein